MGKFSLHDILKNSFEMLLTKSAENTFFNVFSFTLLFSFANSLKKFQFPLFYWKFYRVFLLKWTQFNFSLHFGGFASMNETFLYKVVFICLKEFNIQPPKNVLGPKKMACRSFFTFHQTFLRCFFEEKFWHVLSHLSSIFLFANFFNAQKTI